MTCMPSKDSDQPEHPPSLVSLHCPHEEALGSWPPIEITVMTDRQADLSFHQVQMSFCWFCHAVAHFLAHQRRRLTGELIVCHNIGMPPPYVVCQHFQTSSQKKKPLGRLKLNFIWSLHGMREWKFVQTVQVTWPRWPPCPYMVKTLKTLLLQNRKVDDLETWYATSSAQVLPSCSNDDPWLTFTYFTARSNLVPYAFVWEKGKTMDLSEIIFVYDVYVGICS